MKVLIDTHTFLWWNTEDFHCYLHVPERSLPMDKMKFFYLQPAFGRLQSKLPKAG